MVLLGWFLHTFGIVFTLKILQMDFHNCFNFIFIWHKVTFHVELPCLWSSPLLSHDEAFKWNSSHCHGENIISIHKPRFMLSIYVKPNTFFLTQIWSCNQGWMWTNNLCHQVHLGLSLQLGCYPIARCKCLQFDLQRGHISKTSCNMWGCHTRHPLYSCILCTNLSYFTITIFVKVMSRSSRWPWEFIKVIPWDGIIHLNSL
jgi:hypothetical protein